ncbi:MAG: CrcB family protein [Micromonosporaceae bacterium]|nr:CrcB family protein [Micromonosporaceae bacterium]
MRSHPQAAARQSVGRVGLRGPRRPADVPAGTWPVLAVIAAGGVVGALARYGIQLGLPHRPGGFPWSTFLVNITGCLLIGALMVLIVEVWSGARLLRPFLGVGVLGGYTTFSTYVLDIQQAVTAAAAATALLYLAATLLGALFAVWAGAALTTRTVRWLRRASDSQGGEQ